MSGGKEFIMIKNKSKNMNRRRKGLETRFVKGYLELEMAAA